MSSDLTDTDILHVITRSDWGGAPRVVQLLATGTEANTAVACGTGGTLINKLQEDDIPVFEQPHLKRSIDPLTDARALRGVTQLLRRESFDLVHCHSTKAGAFGRLAAAWSDTPSIFTVHGWGFYNTEYGWMSPVIAQGERSLARVTDAIVCVSENDYDQGQENGILQNTDGHVIHNGIPPISFSEDRTTLADEIDIDPETIVIGAIARLAPQKNPLGILETGARLQERGHDVTVVLIGDGPLASECREYVENHQIDAHLLGFHPHALELLPDLDVFLFPSRFEGFPIVLLECLHVGIPVTAYDVGGVSEAIVDGETGYLVDSGDHATFVDQAEQLVTDSELREQMRSRSRQLARERFTADQMVQKYDSIYESVLHE
jgi:glycosyltransferase involved in cell wall biosynthesis